MSYLRLPPVDQLGGIARWMSKPPTPKSVIEQIKALKIRETRPNENYLVYHEDNPVSLGEFPPPPAIIGKETDPIKDLNCFALNFGWPEELNSISSFSMSIDPNKPINIASIRTTIHGDCFIVMIGGKYVPRIKDIVRKVDIVSEQLEMQPAVYYAEKTDLPIPEDTPVSIVNVNIIKIIKIILAHADSFTSTRKQIWN